jgi:hypothetical protein
MSNTDGAMALFPLIAYADHIAGLIIVAQLAQGLPISK